jgi:hypothetical protein
MITVWSGSEVTGMVRDKFTLSRLAVLL